MEFDTLVLDNLYTKLVEMLNNKGTLMRQYALAGDPTQLNSMPLSKVTKLIEENNTNIKAARNAIHTARSKFIENYGTQYHW